MSKAKDSLIENLHARLQALDEDVRHLRDCEEIRQVMYAYARGVDRADQALIAPTFHDDAFDDHGNFKGGKAETLAALKRSSQIKETTASFHHLGNILIDLKGDEADVETYFIAVQRREEDGKAFSRIRAGRYLDRFAKRDGNWRVLKRTVVDDWSRLDEIVATAREVTQENHHGTRNREDPSYRIDGFVDDRKK